MDSISGNVRTSNNIRSNIGFKSNFSYIMSNIIHFLLQKFHSNSNLLLLSLFLWTELPVFSICLHFSNLLALFTISHKDFFTYDNIYIYYFLVFFMFHVYFTFSKLYFLRCIVIIRGYLKNSDYVKLFLWSVFVPWVSLITTLL